MPPGNGWSEHAKLVLHELERLNDCYETLAKDLARLKNEFVALRTEFKIKAGFWGLLGGAIPVIIGLGYWILKGR